MEKQGINMKVTRGGWVEVFNKNYHELYCECFYNLLEVAAGAGFIAVRLRSGKVEIYNYKLQLITAKIFRNIKTFMVNDFIEIVFESGEKQIFDRDLKPQTKMVA